MSRNVTQKLIESHLVEGVARPGEAISLRIDQTLTQDATGTLVMLTLEALGLDRARTRPAVQYIDHNLMQEDHRNPDDHLFLLSAARRFGMWCARPGTGVSHPLHMRYFGRPGATLLGSDSHTCAAGSLGMLAIGTGGLDVATAIAGEPYRIAMPEIWGVRLTGQLVPPVSAKDVILEMLRRHGVDGARGRIVEYHGPGVATLSAMDRHVIANMGQELGHVSTVFPSDTETRRFLENEDRGDVWREIRADEGASYDHHETIDLATVEPLIALPSSPGNVVRVREVEGREIYQAYIGSSANPGFRDFAVVAEIVRGATLPPDVSLDVNPATRDLLADLVKSGHFSDLLAVGARIHQPGCNGCIGMGQAPASGRNSLRTVPRNFPGRSGTSEDSVYLCSPETAAASALTGRITDPRDIETEIRDISLPHRPRRSTDAFQQPLPPEEAGSVELVKGPNIQSLPELVPVPNELLIPILLVAGDDISTDEILPAGAAVLPYRSNVQRIAEFAFRDVDPNYPARAEAVREQGGHAIVGGRNYGQGSSREHAALAPRYLGLCAVVARSYARIHRRNLINYGVLPLTLPEKEGRGHLKRDAVLRLSGVQDKLADPRSDGIWAEVGPDLQRIRLNLNLTAEERAIVAAGGLVNALRDRTASAAKRN